MAQKNKDKKIAKNKRSEGRMCVLYDALFRHTRLVRDVVAVTVVAAACGLLLAANWDREPEKNTGNDVKIEVDDEEKAYWENVDQVEDVLASVDTAGWKTYQNTWYGFEVKYPEDWSYPVSRAATRNSKWEYRYEFRKNRPSNSDAFAGFDVVVYNIEKVEDIFGTEELPGTEDEESADDPGCRNIKWNLIEPWDYPAEEIRIPVADNCHDPALFFSLTRERYIYNFVAIAGEDGRKIEDPFEEIKENFPQFFAAASTLDLVDIKRPPPKPKITAPKPASFKIDEKGRMVCAKKNDKPGKSKQGKDHHLDMECCLDPDEDPNPWCYYDPAKYGKYL